MLYRFFTLHSSLFTLTFLLLPTGIATLSRVPRTIIISTVSIVVAMPSRMSSDSYGRLTTPFTAILGDRTLKASIPSKPPSGISKKTFVAPRATNCFSSSALVVIAYGTTSLLLTVTIV